MPPAVDLAAALPLQGLEGALVQPLVPAPALALQPRSQEWLLWQLLARHPSGRSRSVPTAAPVVLHPLCCVCSSHSWWPMVFPGFTHAASLPRLALKRLQAGVETSSDGGVATMQHRKSPTIDASPVCCNSELQGALTAGAPAASAPQETPHNEDKVGCVNRLPHDYLTALLMNCPANQMGQSSTLPPHLPASHPHRAPMQASSVPVTLPSGAPKATPSNLQVREWLPCRGPSGPEAVAEAVASGSAIHWDKTWPDRD